MGDGFVGEVYAEVGSYDEDGVCFVCGEDVNHAGFDGVVVDDAGEEGSKLALDVGGFEEDVAVAAAFGPKCAG